MNLGHRDFNNKYHWPGKYQAPLPPPIPDPVYPERPKSKFMVSLLDILLCHRQRDQMFGIDSDAKVWIHDMHHTFSMNSVAKCNGVQFKQIKFNISFLRNLLLNMPDLKMLQILKRLKLGLLLY